MKNFQFSIFHPSGDLPQGDNFQFLKRQGRISGFTLIEMLIYILLVAVVGSALVFFGFWAIQVGAKTKANTEVLGNARRAMETMVYEIRKATSVYAPTSIFDASPGQLSLATATSTDVDENSAFIDFFLCGQALCLKREKANPVALTNNSVQVTNLTFSQRLNSVSSPSIRINLRVTSTASVRPGATTTIDLTTTANLRVY
ncbi:type II secretion system GspH family protein [Patescibacteria group bacterium]|nr:type II secretion system GspH family protein [Patescibacteria group bacterium]